LTHTFLAIVTVGLGHGVDRKLYTLIGGQRAQKFENHWCKQLHPRSVSRYRSVHKNEILKECKTDGSGKSSRRSGEFSRL